MVAAVLGSAAQTVVPLIARQIVDDVVVARRDALWPWLVLLFAAAALSFALAYVRRYRGGQVGLGVQFDLRNAMHDHLQRLDLAHAVADADRAARVPRQLRLRARAGPAELPAADDRQRADDGAVARRHVRAVAAAGAAGPGRGAGAVRGVLPDAPARLPRHLGRPAARGRRRADRRRGRHRGPRRQGVRPGAARAAPARRRRPAALRLAAARDPAAGALPAAARGDPDRRAGRHPALRRPARPARLDHASARSWRSRPTSGSSPRRPASWPASSPSASRPAPASSGSSGCSTCRAGDRRRARTRSSCPTSAARSSSTTCASATPPTHRCCAGVDLHIAAGERVALVGAERQRQVHRWRSLVSRFYDPDAGRRAASTATTSAA